jgi:hypothetical protein
MREPVQHPARVVEQWFTGHDRRFVMQREELMPVTDALGGAGYESANPGGWMLDVATASLQPSQ